MVRTAQKHEHWARGEQENAGMPDTIGGEMGWLFYSLWEEGWSHSTFRVKNGLTVKRRDLEHDIS